ncbi:MAG TPA: radical SAM protein, partial [Spirochaetota bacterium]|nr:radical SAM protein [Spirochaetota bacterium]
MKEKRPINLLAKPAGPLCNMNCDYCFYLDKTGLFNEAKKKDYFMPETIRSKYVQEYIGSNPGREITFGFQGGEPTLAGLDFFRKLTAEVKKVLPSGKKASFSLQTNGLQLNRDWCRFLK